MGYDTNDDIPEYYKGNVYANYDITEKINVSASINNIFNAKTISNGMLGSNGVLYFVDAPINFFVSVKFKFWNALY